MDITDYLVIGFGGLNLITLLVIYIGEKIQQRQIVRILEDALARAQAGQPALPPKIAPVPAAPPAPPKPAPTVPAPAGPFADYPAWFQAAVHEIGFHETGANLGIERYISLAHAGALGDPWCAIFANAMLESAGVPGSRSASSQSFRTDANFVQLSGPAKGAIAVFWRGSQSSGLGHVGFYRGEDETRIWTLGGNEDDMVEIAALPRSSSSFGLIGYWWPKGQPLPQIGPVLMPGGSPASVRTPPSGTAPPAPTTGTSQPNGIQRGITATYFDDGTTAYGISVSNDGRPGVALPFRFTGQRPQLKVTNPKTGASVVADVVDIGPWNLNDPYWLTGARPQAESGMDLGQTGRVRKTNRAGIDLNLAAAKALSIDGKGLVSWQFIVESPNDASSPSVI